jgi:hypothetical protein
MTLHKPSQEQQTILEHVAKGKHVVVNAVAGSGKSTTILSVAHAFPDKQVLQITYNSMLRHEMKEKVHNAHLENLDVHTFHSLAVKYYLPSAHTDTELRHIILHRLPIQQPPHKNWDILVLDEAQDMSFLYYHFICLFLENLGKNAPKQLMVLGDHQQCLYQFKGADSRFLTMAPRIWISTDHNSNKFTGEMVECSLQTSYRITTPMADFVNQAMLGHDRMLAPREGEPVVYIRNTRHNIEKTVVYIVQQLLEQGHLPSDIFILSGSVKGLNSHIRKMENALCERGIPCHIPTIEQDKLDERVIEGKIVFSTFHCVKGRQRKFVFVVGFDHNYFLHMAQGQDPQQCPNTLYVGCTRAIERLYLLEFNQFAGDRPLEFLKMSHHDMVAADFVEFKGTPQSLFYDHSEKASSNKNGIKKHYLSPTKLIKFISDDVMDILTPIIERVFTRIPWTPDSGLPNMENITIPNVIKTQYGFEDVSDLNGIALPAMFYDYLSNNNNNGSKETNPGIMLDLIEEAIVDMRENEHHYLKTIVKDMPKECVSMGDYLYLSNIYVSIRERLYFKLKQIRRTDYNWLTNEMVETCQTLLKGVMGDECNNNMVSERSSQQLTSEMTEGNRRSLGEVWSEELIISPSMEDEHVRLDESLSEVFSGTDLENTRFRFSAIVDLITPTTVWEIKCTTTITIDHQLQLVIYAWLWGFTNRPKREFKILNIKTGERWVLQSTPEDLQKMVVALLRGKYAKIVEKTDDEFMEGFTTQSPSCNMPTNSIQSNILP